MIDIVYTSTSFMLKIIDTILQTNIRIHGEEYLKKRAPTLFVANHFTRLETLIMPYVINERHDRKIRSLADKSLFAGLLGTYLKHSGALSTADTYRNDIIIGDLMSGRNSWIIYPEGFMVKNKKVEMDDEFIIDVPRHHGSVFTGAALMAIEAEKHKRVFKTAQKNHDEAMLDSLKTKYFLRENEEIAYHSIQIIPVNITYYPLRPGHNALMNMAGVLAGKEVNRQVLEEIEIEGNLLSNAEIHVRFCRPIDLSQFMLGLDLEDKDVLKRLRHKLTTRFMAVVYQNVMITIDHLFSVILVLHKNDTIDKKQLKQILYLFAMKVREEGIYHCHETIQESLLMLLLDEGCPPYEEVVALALEQKILHEEGTVYRIDHQRFSDITDFHRMRLENTLRVIYNEVGLLEELHINAQEALAVEPQKLSADLMYSVFREDLARYHDDYKAFYSVMYSKPKEVGEPFLLYDETYTKGIVFAHGLKSSPSEVRDICEYLYKNGFNVYGVRLKGHGTLPQDLRDVAYMAWVESFNLGYAALRQVCPKIYLGGFSTGGLIALLSASKKQYPLEGIVCINSALQLRDMRVGYVVPTLHAMNDFLSLFNANMDFIDHEAEYPDVNYSRLYVSTVSELRKLMAETYKALRRITIPVLIIQGDSDPVVDPKSVKVILRNIKSSIKELYMPQRDTHVIIKGAGSEEIYERVLSFMERVESRPPKEETAETVSDL